VIFRIIFWLAEVTGKLEIKGGKSELKPTSGWLEKQSQVLFGQGIREAKEVKKKGAELVNSFMHHKTG